MRKVGDAQDVAVNGELVEQATDSAHAGLAIRTNDRGGFFGNGEIEEGQIHSRVACFAQENGPDAEGIGRLG